MTWLAGDDLSAEMPMLPMFCMEVKKSSSKRSAATFPTTPFSALSELCVPRPSVSDAACDMPPQIPHPLGSVSDVSYTVLYAVLGSQMTKTLWSASDAFRKWMRAAPGGTEEVGHPATSSSSPPAPQRVGAELPLETIKACVATMAAWETLLAGIDRGLLKGSPAGSSEKAEKAHEADTFSMKRLSLNDPPCACRCLCNSDWLAEESADLDFDSLGGAPMQAARFSDLLAYSTDMGQSLRGRPLRSGNVYFLRSEQQAEKVQVNLYVNGLAITHHGKEVRACFSPFTLVRNCKFLDAAACTQLVSLKIFKIFFFVKNLCYFFGVSGEDTETERQAWVEDVARAVHLVTQSLFPPFSISCEPICAAAVTARRLMAGYVIYHSGDDVLYGELSAHARGSDLARLAFYENEQCQRLAMEIWLSVASSCFEKAIEEQVRSLENSLEGRGPADALLQRIQWDKSDLSREQRESDEKPPPSLILSAARPLSFATKPVPDLRPTERSVARDVPSRAAVHQAEGSGTGHASPAVLLAALLQLNPDQLAHDHAKVFPAQAAPASPWSSPLQPLLRLLCHLLTSPRLAGFALDEKDTSEALLSAALSQDG
eukprot:g28022.t1